MILLRYIREYDFDEKGEPKAVLPYRLNDVIEENQDLENAMRCAYMKFVVYRCPKCNSTNVEFFGDDWYLKCKDCRNLDMEIIPSMYRH